MNKINLLVIFSIICLLIAIPTAFAYDNETAIAADDAIPEDILNTVDDDASSISDLSSSKVTDDYYFDSNIENDTGDGSREHPYKELTYDRIKDDSNIHLANGNYSMTRNINVHNINIIGNDPQRTVVRLGTVYAYNTINLINLTLVHSHFTASSDFKAKNVIFTDSSSTNGGVIYSNSDINIKLINCTFLNNFASSSGGAVYLENGNLNITDSVFNGNGANVAGGAIYIKKAKLSANNVNISDSSALFGGAIASLSGDVNINKASFKDNNADYYGGAIYFVYDVLSICNSEFDGNTAYNGGALFVDDAYDYLIKNNTFTNNKAENNGGAVYSVIQDDYLPDSVFDKALGNKFSGNVARLNNDAFESNVPEPFIGTGNYTLITYDPSFNESLPSRYDGRDYGYVTSVKNQGGAGNCWAFSTLGTLESCILKANGPYLDFSEDNMKNLMAFYSYYGWSMETNKGGYDDMGIAYLTSWLGPVYETDDAYDTNSLISPVLNSVYHIQNMLFLTRTSYTDNDAIKRAILDYGAVTSSIKFGGSSNYMNGSSYYYNGSGGADHSVMIVGWDDSYSRYNFKTTPPGDGAWIMKNSWGQAGPDKGFYYVSYYDTRITPINSSDSIYTFVLNDSIKYDKNYQYDIPGKTDYFINSSDTAWYKNRFTATDDEYLAAVSTYFKEDTSWEVSIYVNGVLKHTQKGSSVPSYSTIELTKLIPLKAGDTFEVQFKIMVDSEAAFPVSEKIRFNNKIFTANMSFVSYDGENWQDLCDLKWACSGHTYDSQVACIKAFTVLDDIGTNITIEVVDDRNPAIIRAVVTNQYGNPIKSGKLTFTIDGKNIQVDIVDGVCQITHTFKNLGINTVSASFKATGYKDAYASVSKNIVVGDVSIGLNPEPGVFDAVINVKLSKNIDETVKLEVEGVGNYTVKTVAGVGSVKVKNLKYGTYNVKASIDSVLYHCDDASSSFKIIYLNTHIEANNLVTYHNGSIKYSVTVYDELNRTIPNKHVIFKINGNSKIEETDNNGIASFYLNNFECGSYQIFMTCTGEGDYIMSATDNKITIKSTIELPAQTRYTTHAMYSAILFDENGNRLQNRVISVLVDGNPHSLKTDGEGRFYLDVDFNSGTHYIEIKNLKTNETKPQSIDVFNRITKNSNVVMYYGAGTNYIVKVWTDDAQVAKNVKVSFKINNGKTLTRTTNNKGFAYLLLSLKPGTYTVTATYNGFTVSNNITVKPILITSNIVVKKGKTISFAAKLLNSKGQVMKNKKVSFTFKGRTYKILTSSKGYAILKLNNKYKVGKYTITTSYGNYRVTNKITIR